MQLKSLVRNDNFLLHSKFHPDWGQLFKSGYQDSRFATQVGMLSVRRARRFSPLASFLRPLSRPSTFTGVPNDRAASGIETSSTMVPFCCGCVQSLRLGHLLCSFIFWVNVLAADVARVLLSPADRSPVPFLHRSFRVA